MLNIFTGWNDKIVAQEKTIWFHFRSMKTGFLFCCRPSTSWTVVYKSQLWQQDHCQHPKTQIRVVQRAQGDENKVFSYGYGLWCGFKWGPYHAASHLRSRLESQNQSVPGCAEECGDPLVQSGGWWQTLGVAAGLRASPQVQRDPGLASEGVLRLFTLLSLPLLLLPRPEPAVLLRLVISREHLQHDLPQHQSQPDRPVFAEIPVEKACSQFRIRVEAVIEVEDVYIELMSALLY